VLPVSVVVVFVVLLSGVAETLVAVENHLVAVGIHLVAVESLLVVGNFVVVVEAVESSAVVEIHPVVGNFVVVAAESFVAVAPVVAVFGCFGSADWQRIL